MQCHGAEDTGEAEHILSLEERTVIGAVYLYGYGVGAIVQVLGDVELGSVA